MFSMLFKVSDLEEYDDGNEVMMSFQSNGTRVDSYSLRTL